MSPNNWGPPIWVLFHTIAAKIKEDTFNYMGPQFFNIIKKICRNLPCPDCSEHATNFLSKVNFQHIKNKNDLIALLYIFHNFVNKRKKKNLYNSKNLESYNQSNLNQAYINFSNVYKTKGNMKLLADNFQRQIIINELKKWLNENRNNFNLLNHSTNALSNV